MKTTVSLLGGILALLLPINVFADPKPAAHPQQIWVKLQTLEVPAGTTPVPASNAAPAVGFYNSLLKNPKSEATEISVVTPPDFPGSAQYTRFFTFTTQEHGMPSLNIVTAPMTLVATPHINSDGTITVRLTLEVTSFVPSTAPTMAGAVPNTTSQHMTTTRTFKAGKTVLLNGVLQTTPKSNGGIGTEQEELLQFVTVQILPDEKMGAR